MSLAMTGRIGFALDSPISIKFESFPSVSIQNMSSRSSNTQVKPSSLVSQVVANSGFYATSFNLFFVVGQYPILIIDLDGNQNSAVAMQDAVANLDLTAHYRTSFTDELDM